LTGLGLALAACGHRDQRLVDQYFNAVNAKDNQTLGSFAAVGFDKKVDRWRIAKESDEEKAPIPLTDLIAKQKELEKAVADNKKAATAYSMDHYAEVDAVRRSWSEVGGRQVLDGRAGLRKAVPDGARDRRNRSIDSGALCAHARTRLGQRGSLVRRVRRAGHLQAGSPGWPAGGQDPVDERGS